MPPLTSAFLLTLFTLLAVIFAPACESGLEPAGGEAPLDTGKATALPTTAPSASPPPTEIPEPTASPGATLKDDGGSPAPATEPPLLPAAAEDTRSETELSEDADRAPQQQSPIQAGEIDDNAAWDEYLHFARAYEGPAVRATQLQERYLITVTGPSRLPVQGARVTIRYEDTGKTTTVRTHADGRALHHPQDERRQGQITFSVAHQDIEHPVTVGRSDQGTGVFLTLPGAPETPAPLPLDVLFLLDATGSMADEIDRIKETLLSIGRQIADLPQQPSLRTALVAYRDRGDDFVTRIFDFNSDVSRLLATIQDLQAEGGNDYPESLNQALHEALADTSWREESVKLLFLIADAPPHLDYEQDEDYVREIARAQEEGVKIFAVASSGLDEQGEYIFRQLAQQTMGRFIFILYETPPQGELTTPHDVGAEYTVENLDRIIVRLIDEELAAMSRPATREPIPQAPAPRRHASPGEAAARQLAAQHLNASPDTLVLLRAKAVSWPDASMGCPQEGQAYAAVETRGFRYVFSHAEGQAIVHTDEEGRYPFIPLNCATAAGPRR